MTSRLKSLPHLSVITPYQSSASRVVDKGGKIRLCYNEGAFGPGPRAIEAMRGAAYTSHCYPDMCYTNLRDKLAERFKLDANRIVCGAGSDDLIGLLAHAFLTAGDEVVLSQYGFSMYAVAAKAVGAKPVMVPEIDFRTDLKAMLKAVTPKTKAVFLANPNNPTGSWLTRSEIAAFLRDLREDILFVYDAAYADYMDEPDYSDGLEWAAADGRVCVLRTFSKIHGLGGMRLGWAYGPDVVIDALNRVRNPFNVSAMVEAAAIASLKDEAFLEKSRTHTIAWREKLYDKLMEIGLHPYPSKGNFILVATNSAEHAKDLFRYLDEKNILTRPMAGYGLPDCIRISIGRDEEMDALFTALNAYKDSDNAQVKQEAKNGHAKNIEGQSGALQ
jgi:histidinol-phosphate aminotransferase